MNTDGTGETRLTNNEAEDSQISWSPDGKQLAFVSDMDGNQEIYVMKADGSKIQRLTFNEAAEGDPVWSRDGSKIAFVSYTYGTAEIFVMNADGSDQIRLTNNFSDDSQPSGRWDSGRAVLTSPLFTPIIMERAWITVPLVSAVLLAAVACHPQRKKR